MNQDLNITVRLQEIPHLPNHLYPSVTLRLSVYAMLNSRFEEAFASVGLCCSSYVVTSRGSTHRSFITPMGNENFLKVMLSNQMTSRTVPTVDLGSPKCPNPFRGVTKGLFQITMVSLGCGARLSKDWNMLSTIENYRRNVGFKWVLFG